MSSKPNEENMDEENKDNRRRGSLSNLVSPARLYTIAEEAEDESLSIDLNSVNFSSDTSSGEYDFKPPLYTRQISPKDKCGEELHQKDQSWHGNALASDYGLSRQEEEAFCSMIKGLDKGDAGNKKYKDEFGMEAGPSRAFGYFGASSGMPKGSAVPKGEEGLLAEPEQEGASSSAASCGKKKEDGSGEAPK